MKINKVKIVAGVLILMGLGINWGYNYYRSHLPREFLNYPGLGLYLEKGKVKTLAIPGFNGKETEKNIGEEKIEDNSLIVPGIGAAGIRIGDSPEQVKAVLGKPQYIYPSKENLKSLFYYKRNFFMNIVLEDNAVSRIGFIKYKGRTKEGVGIGNTREEVIAALGPPSKSTKIPITSGRTISTLSLAITLGGLLIALFLRLTDGLLRNSRFAIKAILITVLGALSLPLSYLGKQVWWNFINFINLMKQAGTRTFGLGSLWHFLKQGMIMSKLFSLPYLFYLNWIILGAGVALGMALGNQIGRKTGKKYVPLLIGGIGGALSGSFLSYLVISIHQKGLLPFLGVSQARAIFSSLILGIYAILWAIVIGKSEMTIKNR